jgi:hypothetical protein
MFCLIREVFSLLIYELVCRNQGIVEQKKLREAEASLNATLLNGLV